jgi:hypothetical protein
VESWIFEWRITRRASAISDGMHHTVLPGEQVHCVKLYTFTCRAAFLGLCKLSQGNSATKEVSI